MPHPPNFDADPELWRNSKYVAARYREVHALLISAEDDSPSVEPELLELSRTLRKDYAIITRIVKGEDNLLYELSEFERILAAPDIFLLVFFDGRSTIPGFDIWGLLQPLFSCHADVLAIFHEKTGEPAPEIPNIADGGNIADVIRTHPDHVDFPESQSFTYHVIRTFRYMREKPIFSSRQFSAYLQASLKQDDRKVRSSDNRYEGQPSRKLIYIKFANKRRPTKQEIIIMPFRGKDMERYSNMRSHGRDRYQRWGPLGALPEGWEKRLSGYQTGFRPYYHDGNTQRNYWTRPWSSACGITLGWESTLFAAFGVQALSFKMMESRTLLRIATYGDVQDEERDEVVDWFQIFINDEIAHRQDEELPVVETAFETFVKWAAELEKSDNLIIQATEKDGLVGLPTELMAQARGHLREKLSQQSGVDMITQDLADL